MLNNLLFYLRKVIGQYFINLDKAILIRLINYAVFPYSKKLIVAFFFMIIVAFTTALLAWLMDPVVNKVFVERNSDLLIPLGVAVFIVFCVKGLATYSQTVIISNVGQNVLLDLQKILFKHLLTQDLSFFKLHSTGSLVSRFTTDIIMMRQAVSSALTGLGKDSLSVIFLVVLMFYQDWLLATIAFVAFPVSLFPLIILGRRLRIITSQSQERTGRFMTLLHQAFNGIRLIKSYQMETYEADKANELATDIKNLSLDSNRLKALSSPVMETVGGLAVSIVIIYGGWRVIQDATTPGAFFSFITALIMAYRPMKSLAKINAQIQEGLAGAERLFLLLDTQPKMDVKCTAKSLEIEGGEVSFVDVSFSYIQGQEVLKKISFEAPQGKITALVGPSGSGKSTILNLVSRFYDINQGKILIDGQNIAEISLSSLRYSLGLVTQDIVIFDDTIKTNILFGKHDASDEELDAAVRAAGADDFINKLPNGIDTLVGERGENLSGGERQRIAIARAIIKDPPILLMDEATSALDNKTERQVQLALDNLRMGRTSIVIAHRLETIKHADLIHVIADGRVIESGKHMELIELGKTYAHLYENHFEPGH